MRQGHPNLKSPCENAAERLLRQLSPEAIMAIPFVKIAQLRRQGGGRPNLGSVTWASLPPAYSSDLGLTAAMVRGEDVLRRQRPIRTDSNKGFEAGRRRSPACRASRRFPWPAHPPH
jgi:hypothetical protein